MSIIHFGAMPAATGGIDITLSGGFAQDFDITFAEVGFQFTSTGFVQKYEGGGTTTLNSATDWMFPRTAITPGDWQVRGAHTAYTQIGSGVSQVGNSLVPAPSGTGAWNTLTSTRTFRWRASTTTFGPIRGLIATVRFEMRNTVDTSFNTETSVLDAAAIAADGLYSFNVEAFTLN